MNIIKLLNENQGVISLIGLFFVIPFALTADRLISRYKVKHQRLELKIILLKELWMNINFVAQIEKSYNNNLLDTKALHIPHYPPRTETISKFFEFELLNSLNMKEKNSLIEIYSQLEGLKAEYFRWRDLIISSNLVMDKEMYKIISSTMISYIDPTMRNMLEFWSTLVRDYGNKSDIAQIQNLRKLLKELIRKGKWIRTSYKSTFFNKSKYKDIPKFDVIMCWEHNWEDTHKHVVELKDLIPLHESWKDINKG